MADMFGSSLDNSKNHGAYVSAVFNPTKEWVSAGLISANQKGSIIKCATKSN